jgi:hypothetical protein
MSTSEMSLPGSVPFGAKPELVLFPYPEEPLSILHRGDGLAQLGLLGCYINAPASQAASAP